MRRIDQTKTLGRNVIIDVHRSRRDRCPIRPSALIGPHNGHLAKVGARNTAVARERAAKARRFVGDDKSAAALFEYNAVCAEDCFAICTHCLARGDAIGAGVGRAEGAALGVKLAVDQSAIILSV